MWVPIENPPEEIVRTLRGSPMEWLPGEVEDRGPGHYGVELHSGPITRRATVGVGAPDGDERSLRCRLVWKVDHEPGQDELPEEDRTRALPSFEGQLRLEPQGERRADLRLEGAYQPPTGTVGRAMNPAQAQAMAEHLVRWFLSEVAAHLLDDD